MCTFMKNTVESPFFFILLPKMMYYLCSLNVIQKMIKRIISFVMFTTTYDYAPTPPYTILSTYVYVN